MKYFAKQRQWVKEHKGVLIAAGIGLGVGAFAGYKLFSHGYNSRLEQALDELANNTTLPDIEVPCTVTDPDENIPRMADYLEKHFDPDDTTVPSSLELAIKILRQNEEELVLEIEDICPEDLGQFGQDLIDAELLDEEVPVQARLHIIY